jgi:hypothetical protein
MRVRVEKIVRLGMTVYLGGFIESGQEFRLTWPYSKFQQFAQDNRGLRRPFYADLNEETNVLIPERQNANH